MIPFFSKIEFSPQSRRVRREGEFFYLAVSRSTVLTALSQSKGDRQIKSVLRYLDVLFP
jgi:hypothetical protein